MGKAILNKAWGRIMLRGLAAWTVCAVLLCLICSALLCWDILPAHALGYLCSVMSFLTALAAGIAVGKEGGGLIGCVGFSVILLVLLLTLGWLISDGALTSSGLLSVASFTLAGCLLGLIFPSGLSERKDRRPGNKRRFKLRIV